MKSFNLADRGFVLKNYIPSSFISFSFLLFSLPSVFPDTFLLSLPPNFCIFVLHPCPLLSMFPFVHSLLPLSPFHSVLPPDDIAGPQPGPFLVSVMGASLQSLPLPLPPPPPPSHATIQHSLSLNGKTRP